jgi:LTXXQ motif family protein
MLTRLTGSVAVLLLSLFAISPASAQPNKPGQAAAPHGAAPASAAAAPHAAPSAPAAPRVSTPQAAAPARSAAPHVALPQRAPSVAASHPTPQHYSGARSAGPSVTQRAPALQRAPERSSSELPPEQTRGAAQPAQSAPSPAPAAERAQVDYLRQQQQRELRSQAGRVPPAQFNELRAQQRQQLEQLQARENEARQRASMGRPTPPSMGQNAPRVAPQVAARIAPDAARQGRFAAAYAPRNALASAEAFPNWTAWGLRRRAAFVPWSGALFWPYVYTDMFYYAFWPAAYDGGYWAYAYDDLLDGAYWAYGDPYAAYAYVGPNPDTAAGLTGGRLRTGGREVAAACAQSANVANWPFGRIEGAIAPTPEQQELLNNLQSAANRAANMLRTSCPSSFPLTPPGRVQAMTARLEATLAAVDLVRPPLTQFYDTLNDEQKARFNAIGPEIGHEDVRVANNAGAEAQGACGKAKPGLIDLQSNRSRPWWGRPARRRRPSTSCATPAARPSVYCSRRARG